MDMSVSKRILIIEDEEILADNIRAFLKRSQCEVRVAGSAEPALAMLDEFAPDVVIVDYHLPGMNGFQAVDAIRGRQQECRCVLITGHPSDEVHTGVRQRGIRDVLFKPFAFDDLARALNRRDEEPTADAALETTCPPMIEHRTGERRSRSLFSLPFRLPDGGWLFADRRHTDRRS